VKVPGSDHFMPTENLGGGEYTFAVLDIVLRMMRSDPRPVPWMLIVDSSMFLRLDADNHGVWSKDSKRSTSHRSRPWFASIASGTR
jgi:hypothetical protein